MVQRQPVGTGRVQRGIGTLGFILGDHLFAAAGVTRQAGAVQQRRFGHKAQFYQRGHRGNKAGGVAAGHGHAGGGFQRLAGAVELGQAVESSRGPCGARWWYRARGHPGRSSGATSRAASSGRQRNERSLSLMTAARAWTSLRSAAEICRIVNSVPFGQAGPQCAGRWYRRTAVHEDFVLSHCYTPDH